MYNKTKQNRYSFVALLLFIVIAVTSSCINTKKIIYFNDLPDSSSRPYLLGDLTTYVEPKIENSDILAITVQTIVANSQTPITSSSTGTFSSLNGFMVDKNGFIELNLIGFVKVAGLTTSEARELIKQKAKEFFKDPVVNVRIANFDVQVLGDVAKVGVVTLSSEKSSLLDALALAGDLLLTARRDNILLIRTEGDQKKFIRFDLRSKNIFQSPYFYLKQHDIIYVEGRKDKLQASDNGFSRTLGLISSFASLISLVLIFRTFK